jgi:hypothetical protein
LSTDASVLSGKRAVEQRVLQATGYTGGFGLCTRHPTMVPPASPPQSPAAAFAAAAAAAAGGSAAAAAAAVAAAVAAALEPAAVATAAAASACVDESICLVGRCIHPGPGRGGSGEARL